MKCVSLAALHFLLTSARRPGPWLWVCCSRRALNASILSTQQQASWCILKILNEPLILTYESYARDDLS